jgi:cellulose synthase/poly-beta-1,6-N-acetylglucosamine synthase-like glycosyltransferase
LTDSGSPAALYALAALLAAAWLALAARLALWRRRAPALPPPFAELPPTTVLLPVRDEEANLAECAATLLAQRGAPSLRVIDDGSTDRTPEILAGLAAREPRVTALRARPLAAGWGGKVNALATGLEGVTTPWILLTDADTRHQPELLARAHAAAADHRLDALSLSGRQVTAGLGESLLTPAAYALLDLLLGDWRPYARGDGPTPIANGQYFLLKADALRAIGGFASIADNPLDDVALAARLNAGGFKVGFLRAGEALQVRMYRGARATWRGWRRNFALFVAARPAASLVAVTLPIATAVTMILAFVGQAPAALSICWLGGVVTSATTRRGSGNNPFTAAFFPLDVLLLAATLVLARIDRARGRAAPWRGREITIRK